MQTRGHLPAPSPQAVFLELGKPHPTIKLLYVTPEQLVKGGRLKDALRALDSRVRRGARARACVCVGGGRGRVFLAGAERPGRCPGGALGARRLSPLVCVLDNRVRRGGARGWAAN